VNSATATTSTLHPPPPLLSSTTAKDTEYRPTYVCTRAEAQWSSFDWSAKCRGKCRGMDL
jgi:hypothetical protein